MSHVLPLTVTPGPAEISTSAARGEKRRRCDVMKCCAELSLREVPENPKISLRIAIASQSQISHTPQELQMVGEI